jgi:hypothetical protein
MVKLYFEFLVIVSRCELDNIPCYFVALEAALLPVGMFPFLLL